MKKSGTVLLLSCFVAVCIAEEAIPLTLCLKDGRRLENAIAESVPNKAEIKVISDYSKGKRLTGFYTLASFEDQSREYLVERLHLEDMSADIVDGLSTNLLAEKTEKVKYDAADKSWAHFQKIRSRLDVIGKLCKQYVDLVNATEGTMVEYLNNASFRMKKEAEFFAEMDKMRLVFKSWNELDKSVPNMKFKKELAQTKAKANSFIDACNTASQEDSDRCTSYQKALERMRQESQRRQEAYRDERKTRALEQIGTELQKMNF